MNNLQTDFDFEFKTRKEFYQKQREHHEFNFNCVRVKTTHHDGYKVDFPLRTEEEYQEFLSDSKWQSKLAKVEVYPSNHFFEHKEY